MLSLGAEDPSNNHGERAARKLRLQLPSLRSAAAHVVR